MSLKEVQQSNCNNEGKSLAQDFICPNSTNNIMELLNLKAEERFREWLFNTHGILPENTTHDVHIYALITQWLDSVNIYIITAPFATVDQQEDTYQDGTWNYYIYDNKSWLHDKVDFTTRQEAWESAIIKANEIYNTRSEAIACCSNSLNQE